MILAPSILSADFLNLARDILDLQKAGADYIHIDIMDAVFTKYATWGPPTVKAIRKITNLTLDVHLMIDKPERIMDQYLASGADIITIHPEATNFLRRTLLNIRKAGKKAGVALKLESSTELIKNSLDLIDQVLLLCCDEGLGGEPFNALALNKIDQVVKMRQENNLDFKIEVDGGINYQTGRMCLDHGADILVSGSYIFKGGLEEKITELKALVKNNILF